MNSAAMSLLYDKYCIGSAVTSQYYAKNAVLSPDDENSCIESAKQ